MKRKVFAVLLVFMIFVNINVYGFGNLIFFDGPLNFYPTFLIIKEEHPEFLQRLKDSWRVTSDDDAKKEEAIAAFLKDLDTDIMSMGELNESNFNGIMYTSFKKVIYNSKHRSVLRALMTGFPEEIDYTEKTGRLHPNLYPLRDSVKKAVLTRSISDIYPSDRIITKQYTNIEELDLPKTVDIRTDNNSRETIPVKWDLISDYNGNLAGEYIIKGSLDLTNFQYIIPTEKKAMINVLVLPYKMPSGGKTIIIGNEGYKVDSNLGEEINTKLNGKEEVFIKLADDTFIDRDGYLVELDKIPAITYYFSDKIIAYYGEMDGEMLE